MEFHKSPYFKKLQLNRFALTIIASAVLMINAETARAVSCPSIIGDNSLAGTVCDFDSGSSVTVENGGVVGGINMLSFIPTPPSHITIDTGGLISNTTGIAIDINDSSLSHGIFNSGTISNVPNGAGIQISNNSIISGSITNNGLIDTHLGSISVDHSIINDGILNNGSISTTGGTNILVANSSIINGGITNSGTMSVGGNFIGIAIINQSIVNGDITNNGDIESVTGNSIIIRESIINGGISNSGTLNSSVVTGMQVLNLSQIIGDVTNTGTISGDIDGLSIHNASSVSGNILNSGAIRGNNGNGISIFSSTNISGAVSNSGIVQGGNTGIAVNLSSNINGGISNSGVIQGDLFAINISLDSTVNDINILGQNARLIGDVQAVNTDVNITGGAIFTSEGSFNVNNFNIASNATFNMANTITANNVNNAGTLAVGDLSQTIIGNYTQNTGGIFQTDITSTGRYGQLVVSGALDLSASGNIAVALSKYTWLIPGDTFNVMSGNSLITPVDGFKVTDNSFFWEFVASTPNSTGVTLTTTVNPGVYSVCQGSYCQGAANTIIGQIIAGNVAFFPYSTIETSQEFQTAVSQATPELTNENIQVTQMITKSVMDIVPMWGHLHGQSAGDTMISQPGKIWLKPYGGSMTQNKSDSVQGFDATAYGIVLGKDIQPAEDWILGGALAIGKNTIDGKSVLDSQSIQSNEFQGMVYAAKKFPHQLYLAGQGLVGYGDNDTKRTISLLNVSTTEGSYNSWFTNIRTQLGWSVYTANQDLVFTPEIDLSYLFVNQRGYEESGSTMDLIVDANNNSSLVLGAYGHLAYKMATLHNKQDMTLTGYVGVSKDVLSNQPETTATFVVGGPSFSTFGVQINEFVFRGGLGLTFSNPSEPLYVQLNYDLQSGNNAYSGVGTVTVAYKM